MLLTDKQTNTTENITSFAVTKQKQITALQDFLIITRDMMPIYKK